MITTILRRNWYVFYGALQITTIFEITTILDDNNHFGCYLIVLSLFSITTILEITTIIFDNNHFTWEVVCFLQSFLDNNRSRPAVPLTLTSLIGSE